MKEKIKENFISNYTIDSYYGRYGNNLQQIGLAIMYANLYKKNFYLKSHEYLNDFKVVNNRFSNILKKYKHGKRFYYFNNDDESYSKSIDYPLKIVDKPYYVKNFDSVFKKFIVPNIKYKKDILIDKDTLVMHVRNGDIFEKNYKNLYIQNPLNYFINVMDRFKKTIIVTSKPLNNPVMEYLINRPNVEVCSSSVEDDFNLLMNAENLATSGVGTFPIAAALCSSKLKNLYYSDIYFNHHLNPELVRNVNHVRFRFGNYLKLGSHWEGTDNQKNLMVSDQIKVQQY